MASAPRTSGLLNMLNDALSQVRDELKLFQLMSAVDRYDVDPGKIKHWLLELDRLFEGRRPGRQEEFSVFTHHVDKR